MIRQRNLHPAPNDPKPSNSFHETHSDINMYISELIAVIQDKRGASNYTAKRILLRLFGRIAMHTIKRAFHRIALDQAQVSGNRLTYVVREALH